MTQRDQILTHIKRYGSITPIQALNKYGCFRLAGRIFELRCQGHDIQTVMVKRNGKRYARYRL